MKDKNKICIYEGKKERRSVLVFFIRFFEWGSRQSFQEFLYQLTSMYFENQNPRKDLFGGTLRSGLSHNYVPPNTR